MHPLDEPQESRLLGKHASDEHQICPINVRVVQGGGIQVQKSQRPLRGQESGHRNHAEGRCRVLRSHQLAARLVVPESQGREFRVEQQRVHISPFPVHSCSCCKRESMRMWRCVNYLVKGLASLHTHPRSAQYMRAPKKQIPAIYQLSVSVSVSVSVI